MVQYRIYPGVTLGLLTATLGVTLGLLKVHMSPLVGSYVPTNVIRARNKDKPWFIDQCRHVLASSRRLIFGGPVIAHGLTGKSLSTVKVRANKIYSDDKR